MTNPWKAITLNGFTFSVVVACGFSIQSTSSYANVIKSPVFWQFGSESFRLEFKSAVFTSILESKANSGSIDQ